MDADLAASVAAHATPELGDLCGDPYGWYA
jgi:hypothetical protein